MVNFVYFFEHFKNSYKTQSKKSIKQIMNVHKLMTNFVNVFLYYNVYAGRKLYNMAVWGYIRVSSRDQNEDRQVEEIRPLVTTESHLLIEKQTGKDFNRPIYQSLKNIMREDDTLVIKSLDRLGRNYEQMKDEWEDLSDRGIKIKVLDTPLLDTSKYDDDLMGKFVSDVVLNVLSFVAENERKNIRQRQAEGIAVAKAKGIKFGRPKVIVPNHFESVYKDWKKGKIKATEAIKMLRMKKTTFYKTVREIER